MPIGRNSVVKYRQLPNTLIATKASRVRIVSGNDPVLNSGTRRAQN